MEALKAFLLAVLVWLGTIAKPDLRAKIVADRPEPAAIEPGWLYVVGGKGYRKWAYFRCPADTEEIIQLSLMQNRRPRWQVSTDMLGRPSIHPSVRQLDGTYAHFWVRHGRVEWCGDSGKPPRTAHSGGEDEV